MCHSIVLVASLERIDVSCMDFRKLKSDVTANIINTYTVHLVIFHGIAVYSDDKYIIQYI